MTTTHMFHHHHHHHHCSNWRQSSIEFMSPEANDTDTQTRHSSSNPIIVVQRAPLSSPCCRQLRRQPLEYQRTKTKSATWALHAASTNRMPKKTGCAHISFDFWKCCLQICNNHNNNNDTSGLWSGWTTIIQYSSSHQRAQPTTMSSSSDDYQVMWHGISNWQTANNWSGLINFRTDFELYKWLLFHWMFVCCFPPNIQAVFRS